MLQNYKKKSMKKIMIKIYSCLVRDHHLIDCVDLLLLHPLLKVFDDWVHPRSDLPEWIARNSVFLVVGEMYAAQDGPEPVSPHGGSNSYISVLPRPVISDLVKSVHAHVHHNPQEFDKFFPGDPCVVFLVALPDFFAEKDKKKVIR